MIHIISCVLCYQAHDNPTAITRLKHNANGIKTHNSPYAPAHAMRFTNSLLKQNKIEWQHENIALIIQKKQEKG